MNSRGGKTRIVLGKDMRHYVDIDGYPCVTLSRTDQGARVKNNFKLSRLVGEAHLKSPDDPDRYNVLHWDDDKRNNLVSNLRWGTRAENSQDIIRNGNNPRLNRTQCRKGHEYSGDNLILPKRGGRMCRACTNKWKREYAKRNQEVK